MTAPMPDSAPVQYDVTDGVATIRLNRPDAMNSLDIATKELLRETVLHAAEDSAARCVVLTGTGRAFCTGQDLKEHIALLESGSTDELFTAPAHPYTRALLAERGSVEPVKRTFVPIRGEIPSPLSPPSGCHFHPRCPHAMPVCSELTPPLVEIAPGRHAACHLHQAIP